MPTWTGGSDSLPRLEMEDPPNMSNPFAKLIATDVLVPPTEVLLDDLPLRLGRGADADVCVDDRWVSREHCVIDRIDQVLTVCDLGSKHGTLVNGEAVIRAELNPGDELTIGLTKFLVQYELETATASAEREAVV